MPGTGGGCVGSAKKLAGSAALPGCPCLGSPLTVGCSLFAQRKIPEAGKCHIRAATDPWGHQRCEPGEERARCFCACGYMSGCVSALCTSACMYTDVSGGACLYQRIVGLSSWKGPFRSWSPTCASVRVCDSCVCLHACIPAQVCACVYVCAGGCTPVPV